MFKLKGKSGIKCLAAILMGTMVFGIATPVSAANTSYYNNLLTDEPTFYYGNAPTSDTTVALFESVDLSMAGASSDMALEIPASIVSELAALSEGTIISRFKTTSSSTQSLIGISNGSANQQNSHFHVYVSGNRVGFEIRRTSGGDIAKFYKDVSIGSDTIHTLAFKADSQYGYKIFLDGQMILEVPISSLTYGYGFINNIPGINKGFIGKTYRSTATNGYPFTGDIYYLAVDSAPLSDDLLTQYTSTATKKYMYNSFKVFDKEENGTGTLNSHSFRIPSMIRTDNNVLIAAADIRYGNSDDSPNNIDIGIRRSLDNGVTWEQPELVLNFLDYPNVPTNKITNSASYIDSALVKGDNNRIFLICDAFRGGSGQPNCTEDSGFIEVSGVKYLALYDTHNNIYTVRENGIVYDSAGQITTYSVGDYFVLNHNGVEVSNIFYSASPLKVASTSFIVMIYSDDDGATWTAPRILNGEVKSDNMRFFGLGPGIGIQLQNDVAHKGRILVPLYFDDNATKTEFRGVMIYSDDNGLTWHIGEATPEWKPHDGILPERAVFYEIQMVEMPDGQVKMFSRTSKRGKAIVATSFDGGITWEEPYFDSTLVMSNTSGCQLSIINYSLPIDGKPAVIFSNPAATTRTNGTIRVGLINENGTHSNGRTRYEFDWAYSKVIRSGEFAYSILTELPNGNVGMLCEEDKDAGQLDYLAYAEYDIDYLTNTSVQSELLGVSITSDSRIGDTIVLSAEFSTPTEIFGEKILNVTLNGETYEANYLGKNKDENILYFSMELEEYPDNLEQFKAYFNSAVTELSNMFGGGFEGYNPVVIDSSNLGIVFNANGISLSGVETIDKTSELSKVLGISEGTVILRFNTSQQSASRKMLFAASRSSAVQFSSNMSEFSLSLEGGYIRHDIVENGVRLFSAKYASTSPMINDGNWHTVVFSVSEEGNLLYLDGRSITAYPSYSYFLDDVTALDSLIIGGVSTSAGIINIYQGEIGTIQILNKPLSASQIELIK